VEEVQENVEGAQVSIGKVRETVEEVEEPVGDFGETAEGVQGALEGIHGATDEVNGLQHDRKLLASNLLEVLEAKNYDPDVLQDISNIITRFSDADDDDSLDLRTHRHIFARWLRSLKAEISFRTTTDFNGDHAAWAMYYIAMGSDRRPSTRRAMMTWSVSVGE
jgi:hypothetical protein